MYVPPSSSVSHATVSGTQPLSPPPSPKLLENLRSAAPALTLTPHDQSQTGLYAASDFDPSAFHFDTAAPYAGGGSKLLQDFAHIIPTAFQRVGDDLFIHAEGLPQPIKVTVQEVNTAIQSFAQQRNSAIAGNLTLSLMLFEGMERVQLPSEATQAIVKNFCAAIEKGNDPRRALVEAQWQVSCAAYVEGFRATMDSELSRLTSLKADKGLGSAAWLHDLDQSAKTAHAAIQQAVQTGNFHQAYDAVMAFECQLVRVPSTPDPHHIAAIKKPPTAGKLAPKVDVSDILGPAGHQASHQYSHARSLTGPIPDGFINTADVARLVGKGTLKYMDALVQSGPKPGRSVEEILVVDRNKDPELRRHIAMAHVMRVEVNEMGLPPEKRDKALCLKLMAYVDSYMGGPNPDTSWATGFEQQPILLGQVPPGGGSCRHRALLFSVMAGDMGLDVTLRDGMVGKSNRGAHSWNEVKIGQETMIVDIRNFPDELVSTTSDAKREYFWQPEGWLGDMPMCSRAYK